MTGAERSLAHVRDLRVAHPGGFRLEIGSISVAAGELIAVVGPNGAGKSTLLRALLGLGPLASGDVRLLDVSLATQDRRAVARAAAFIPQGGLAEVPFSVREVVTMGREPHRPRFGALRVADREAVDAALLETDLIALADRAVQSLSGGERQRVAIARALAQRAPFLVLDEPTNHLDLAQAHRLLGLVRDHVDRGGGALIALHDLALAARFATRVLVLHRGTVAADGAPTAVLTEALLAEVFGVRAQLVDGGVLVTAPVATGGT